VNTPGVFAIDFSKFSTVRAFLVSIFQKIQQSERFGISWLLLVAPGRSWPLLAAQAPYALLIHRTTMISKASTSPVGSVFKVLGGKAGNGLISGGS